MMNSPRAYRGKVGKRGLSEVEDILIQDLINVVREKTFGHKVATALNQRKQGILNKAMLNITEANRDQVLSIRAIQSIIDKTEGVSKTEVVFEKYLFDSFKFNPNPGCGIC
jgi:hypothetical protein